VPVTRTLFVVHKWTGLASAIFVLFFSITGAVAVYYSEIDRLNAPGLALPQAVQARPVRQRARPAEGGRIKLGRGGSVRPGARSIRRPPGIDHGQHLSLDGASALRGLGRVAA